MKVLVAGASGAIGRVLLPLLSEAGHEVVGFGRTPHSGPPPVIAVDALDRAAVMTAVRDSAPDAIVNMLTAIPARLHPRQVSAEFALTNRLRAEGTRHLADATRMCGVRRFVAQGLAYAYSPNGTGLAREDEPLWRRPPRSYAPVVDALRELETATAAVGGTVLRLGHLYGPGTMFAAEGSIGNDVREGRMPLAGRGASVFSFVHVIDAATAVLAALEHDAPGVFNIVDDDPAPVADWLPTMADLLGAPRPRRMPTALVRLAAGAWGATYLTALRGADNTRARRTLNWLPRYASWRTGFTEELSKRVAAS